MLPELSHRMSYAPKNRPTRVVARVPIPNDVALRKNFPFSKYDSVQDAIDAAYVFTMAVGTDAWGDEFKTVGYMRPRGGHNKGKRLPKVQHRVGKILGVSHKLRFKNDKVYYCWVAGWVEDGVSRQKEFPYGVIYGEVILPEDSRNAAIECRLAMEKLHYSNG